MAKAARDWHYLWGVWEKFQDGNPGATLKAFAEEQSIPYAQIQVAFNRIKRKKNNQSKQSIIKQSIFAPVSAEEAREVVQKVSKERIEALHVEVLSRLYRCLKRLEEIQEAEKAVEIKTAQDLRNSVSAVSDLVRTLREILPFVIELRDRSDIEAIIGRLEAREFDVTQAALEIAKIGADLPETLKIMLAKSPPLVIAQDFGGIPEDELELRAGEALQHVESQKLHFLPERAAEIRALKEELQHIDHFGPAEDAK